MPAITVAGTNIQNKAAGSGAQLKPQAMPVANGTPKRSIGARPIGLHGPLRSSIAFIGPQEKVIHRIGPSLGLFVGSIGPDGG
jgi:hypothetical protein